MIYFLCKIYLISILTGLIYGRYENKASTPPNIFIYISDDQNQWDYGAGNQEVSTSGADRLSGRE